MTIRIAGKTTRMLACAVAAATVVTTPIPAAAQEEIDEARLRKIEAHIRALQRQVFPGGAGRFFEPEIASGAAQDTSTDTNSVTTTAVTDILARLDAMEQQLQRLTASIEEQANSISQLEERLTALETKAVEEAEVAEDETDSATDSNLSAMTGDFGSDASDNDDAGPQAAPAPSPARLAAVREIAKPQTDDPGEDDYSYGFRLWDAGFFPEARQALGDFIDKYPNHRRQSHARNLMGRAFLDDAKYEDAAKWFVSNFTTDQLGARAPDSLVFLAQTMIAMNDTTRACSALSQFATSYPAEATGRLAEQYADNRRKANCGA